MRGLLGNFWEEKSIKLSDSFAVFVQHYDKKGNVKKIVNRDCVGRDADVLLAKIGVKVSKDIRCIICETDFNHPFVQEELMMPILPIVGVSNIDGALIDERGVDFDLLLASYVLNPSLGKEEFKIVSDYFYSVAWCDKNYTDWNRQVCQ